MLAAGAGTAAAAGAALREWLLRRSLPPRHERLSVPGLKSRVEILIDTWGVPHVYTSSEEDALFAQGYLHARDRLWQMELNRRLARGELAEVLGEAALDTDRFLRRLGLRHLAEKDLEGLDGQDLERLNAYARGANAWIERHPTPIELSLLRLQPRPWSPVDSLAYGRFMAFTQTWNWESEMARARLIAAVGAERAAAMEAGTVAAGVPDRDRQPRPQPIDEAARRFSALVPSGGGSNNWVVAPARSASGHALLANDPHLSPQVPGVWYVVHLSCPDLDVEGASLPGVPGVVIGHNERIAWGITSGIADTADLFVERRHPDGDDRFEFRGAFETAEIRVEEIGVKGRSQPYLESVVSTRHGPLLNGVLGIPESEAPLALSCSLLQLPAAATALWRLNEAQDWPSFLEALEGWHHPCLNFVYADTDGNIGYKFAGRLPVRSGGDGYAPLPGWDGEHEWTGWVPFAEQPQVLNPKEGLFATANTRPDAPHSHLITRDWIDDARWRRIMELLRQRDKHSLEDMAAIQGDQVSIPARETVARLDEIVVEGELATRALQMLLDWDGRMAASSPQAAIYWAFRHELLAEMYPDLDEATFSILEGRGLDPNLQQGNAFMYKGSSILAGHIEKLSSGPVGLRMLAGAFESAVDRLSREQGPEPESWEWGRLHRVPWNHPVGVAQPLLDRVLGLSLGSFPAGGDADTPNQTGIHPWRGYEASGAIASYRQLYDLGDWDRACFVIPPGQSGHPRSPHYGDMLEPWRRVAYRPLLFTRPAVEEATAETIRLTPAIPALGSSAVRSL
jgi:penicillin amidase